MGTDEARIRRQVMAKFAGDNVREDEIVLRDDGEIVIDRRKTKSWAKPMTVGRWRRR